MPYFSSVMVNSFFLNKGINFSKRFDFGWNESIGGGLLFFFINFFSNFYLKFCLKIYFKEILLFMGAVIFIKLLYN